VQYCVQQLCTVQCTCMNRPNSGLLVRFSFPVFSVSLSTAALRLSGGGSMFGRTGSRGSGRRCVHRAVDDVLCCMCR